MIVRKWWLSIGLILFGILFLFTSFVQAQSNIQPQGTVCWPLHYAGITMRVTTDAQVHRLLGAGVTRPSEGDTGGRYFLDSERAATLHVVSYTDDKIGRLILSEGIDPVLRPAEWDQAVSPWFDPLEGFGNFHALRLGASKDEVEKNLGMPAEKLDQNAWKYHSSCACELPAYFIMRFEDDRLIQIELIAPTA